MSIQTDFAKCSCPNVCLSIHANDAECFRLNSRSFFPFDFIYNRRQEVINIGKEDIEKQKKMLSKKKPPKNTADFVKPGDKP